MVGPKHSQRRNEGLTNVGSASKSQLGRPGTVMGSSSQTKKQKMGQGGLINPKVSPEVWKGSTRVRRAAGDRDATSRGWDVSMDHEPPVCWGPRVQGSEERIGGGG